MKLIHRNYGIEMELKENFLNILVVENPEAYAKILMDLWRQSTGEPGDFCLCDLDVEKPLSKHAECILNPFSLSCNDKKILSKLYHELKEISQNELQQETYDLNTKLVCYLDDLTQCVPYPIKFQVDMDILSILKTYDVMLENQFDCLLEQIVKYLKAYHQICHIDIYFFVNLKCYLSSNELKKLYEFAFYEKINLILLEAVNKNKLDCEKTWIIDKDLCIISL